MQESQRGIFLINMMCKEYKRAKKSKNKKTSEDVKYVNCMNKKMSTVDKFTLMSTIKVKEIQDLPSKKSFGRSYVIWKSSRNQKI